MFSYDYYVDQAASGVILYSTAGWTIDLQSYTTNRIGQMQSSNSKPVSVRSALYTRSAGLENSVDVGRLSSFSHFLIEFFQNRPPIVSASRPPACCHWPFSTASQHYFTKPG